MNRCDIAGSAPHFWFGGCDGKKYFKENNENFGRYAPLVRLIQKAIPKHFSSDTKQKFSIIKSKEELVSHLNKFRDAISNNKRGEFSCFVFDSSCTYLAEMYYGNPEKHKHKKYHEICFCVGSVLSSSEIRLLVDHEVCPSRLPAELPLDLEKAEEVSDDELEFLYDSLDSEQDYDEVEESYFNPYERDLTVEDKSEYSINISLLPSLKGIKKLSALGEKLDSPTFYRQVCGQVSNPPDCSTYAIKMLFNAIDECRLSGYSDEGDVSLTELTSLS